MSCYTYLHDPYCPTGCPLSHLGSVLRLFLAYRLGRCASTNEPHHEDDHRGDRTLCDLELCITRYWLAIKFDLYLRLLVEHLIEFVLNRETKNNECDQSENKVLHIV